MTHTVKSHVPSSDSLTQSQQQSSVQRQEFWFNNEVKLANLCQLAKAIKTS